MNKKIFGILSFLILISITFSTSISAVQINTKNAVYNEELKPNLIIENRSLNITVLRYENDELVPVKMCPVYIYVYPSPIPMTYYTNEFGGLPYDPLVYINDDVKINAYHEWYGGQTVILNIKESDPKTIYIELVLDPEKSIIKNNAFDLISFNFLSRFVKIYQSFPILNHLLKL